METISNFEFLKQVYPDLYSSGKLIEHCYSFDENSAKINCRIFIELLSLKIIEDLTGNTSDFVQTDLKNKINFLDDSFHIDFKKHIFTFHEIRKAGNNAAHPEQKQQNYNTEQIIQKTYQLSVIFYNHLKNQNIPIRKFSFPKKSTIQQREFELALAATNKELIAERERIKLLEEKINITTEELSKVTYKNNPEKFDQLTKEQNELKEQLNIQAETEKKLSIEIQKRNEEIDQIKREKESIEIQKQIEINKINRELQEIKDKNEILEKENKSLTKKYSKEISEKNLEIDSLTNKNIEQEEKIQKQHAELNFEKAEQERIKKEKEYAIAKEKAEKEKIIQEKDSELASEKEKIEARSKENEEKIKSKYAIVPLVIILFLVILSYFRDNQEVSKSDTISKPTKEVEIEKPKLYEDNFSNDQGFMDWFKAHEKCKSINMRLPTKDELKTAYQQGLTKTWRHGQYWSDTESVRGSAYLIDTSDGFFHSAFKGVLKLKTKCIK